MYDMIVCFYVYVCLCECVNVRSVCRTLSSAPHRELILSLFHFTLMCVACFWFSLSLELSCDQDFDNRLLCGLILNGVAPDLRGDHSSPQSVGTKTRDQMDMSPVDWVADSIVALSQWRQSGPREESALIPPTFHLTNAAGSPRMSDILQWLATFGYRLSFVSYHKWCLCELPLLDESNPLFPLVDAYFRGRISFPYRYSRVSNSVTLSVLRQLDGCGTPPQGRWTRGEVR
jgi:hypothetical protein